MARRNRQKKSPVAAVCSVLGTLLLIIIVAAYLPITIPRAFGYEIYTVISGSMEPAIPTGSLVYVKYIHPEEIQTEDVIAFYGTDADGSIVTHRVVSNSAAMGNFITKGDANSDNDMNPIPYANYIGKVQLSVPELGGIFQTITGTNGKIAAVSMIGLAIVLEILAAVLQGKREKEE